MIVDLSKGIARPRAARSMLLVGIVAFTSFGASGCSLFGSGKTGDQTGDGATRILIVGDSVTVLSEKEIRAEIDWSDTIEIRAKNGLTTEQLLGGARESATDEVDIGIFMPGYNDVLKDQVDTPALDEMMEIAAGLPCVVWFLLPTDGGYSPKLVEIWNERIRTLAEDHDNVHLSDDWKRLVEASPDHTFVSEADAVHPNAEGQLAIAKVMEDNAKDHCG